MSDKQVGFDLVERIDVRLKKMGFRRQKLADECNFTVTNISRWKTKGCLPDIEVGLKVADFLGMSVRELVTGKKDDEELTDEERELLRIYNILDDSDKRVVGSVMKTMEANYKPESSALAASFILSSEKSFSPPRRNQKIHR